VDSLGPAVAIHLSARLADTLAEDSELISKERALPESASRTPEPEAAPPDSSAASGPTATAPTAIDAEIDALLGGYQGLDEREAERVARDRAAAADEAAARTAPRGQAAGARVSQRPPLRLESWMLWCIPALLVPILGGVLGWAVVKRRDPRAARVIFALGLASGVVASVLFVRYATDLARFTTSLSNDTVIVQPSSTAK
jgi:hypothetical protein